MYKVLLYDRGSYPNNGQVLLDTSSGTNPGLISAETEDSLNEAGSFTFEISHFHPLYDSALLAPLRGYVSVEDDGEEIFYGRIIVVQKKPISGSKQISCEGLFSFLLDAELPIDSNPSEKTAEAYFRSCIEQYNTQIKNNNVVDAAREILAGNVTVTKKAEKHTYKNTEYTEIQSVIKKDLIDCNTGFMKFRRDNQTKKHYIDWLKDSGRENPQAVELARNVVQQSSKDSGEDVFTVVRAIGARQGDDYVKLEPRVLSNDMVNQYGKITRTITFGEATDTTKLTAELNEYIDLIKDRLSLSGDIDFVDMHFIDGTAPKIRCGDIFTGIVGYEGKKLIADTLTRNLLNPGKDKLTLKSEKDLLGKLNSIGANSGSGGRSGSSGSGRRSASGAGTSMKRGLDEAQETNNVLAIRAQTMEGKWTRYEGTGVFQNEDHIAAVAGNFTVESVGGVEYVKLIQGTKFEVSPGGVNSNVGQLIYQHDGRTQDAGELLLKYEGSYAYQHNDEIGQIVGTYTVNSKLDANNPYVAIPVPSDDAIPFINPSMQGYYEKTGHGSISDLYVKSTDTTYNKNKTYYKQNLIIENVTIDSGSGLQFTKDGVAVGIWDKNELSAGMFVEKTEDGKTTYTRLKGSYVQIGTKDLTEVFSVNATTTWIKPSQILLGEATGKKRVTIQEGQLTAYNGVWIDSGTKLYFGNPGGESPDQPASFGLDYSTATKLLKDVAIVQSGNDYMLLGLKADKTAGSYVDTPTYATHTGWSEKGTFSRATTLGTVGDGWSGSGHVFTITATPQNATFKIAFDAQPQKADRYMEVSTPEVTVHSAGYLSIPIKVESVVYKSGEEDHEYTTRYTKTNVKDVSALLEQKTGAEGKSPKITANGTYTPGAAYIGIGQAIVAVPNKISKGTWENGVLTSKISSTGSSSVSISLDADDPDWSGNTATVKIYDGDPAASGVDTGYSVTVNAQRIWNKGNANRGSQITTATEVSQAQGSEDTLSAGKIYKLQSQYKDADGNWHDGGTKQFKTSAGSPQPYPVASGDYAAGWNAARAKVRRDDMKIYRPKAAVSGGALDPGEELYAEAHYTAASHSNTRKASAIGTYKFGPRGTARQLNKATSGYVETELGSSGSLSVFVSIAPDVTGSDSFTNSSFWWT